MPRTRRILSPQILLLSIGALGCGKKAGQAIDGGALPASCVHQLGVTSEAGPRLTLGTDLLLDSWPQPLDAPQISVAFDPPDRTPVPPVEGRLANCAAVKGGSGGWGLRLVSSAGSTAVASMAGGYLTFQISTSNIEYLTVGMEWAASRAQELLIKDYVPRGRTVVWGAWTPVRIPIADFGADMGTIVFPFKVNANINAGQTTAFCFDDIRLESACAQTAMTDAGQSIPDARVSTKDVSTTVDGPIDRTDSPICPSLIPPECGNGSASGAVWGILDECQQDVKYDQTGQAKIGLWSDTPAAGRIYDDPDVPFEGTHSSCLEVTAAAAAMFVYYPGGNGSVTQDLSIYSGGALDFALREGIDLSVEVAWMPSGAAQATSASVQAKDFVLSTTPQGWQQVSIPLCAFAGLNLKAVTTIVSFVLKNQTTIPSRACVDAIRYRRALSCPNYCSSGAESIAEPSRDANGLEDSPPSQLPPPDAVGQTIDSATIDTLLGDAPIASLDAPSGGCTIPLVPQDCVADGGILPDVFGLFLDCKQDLPLDQPGGGKIGLWTGVTGGAQILSSPSRTPFEGGNAVCTQVTQGAASSFVYVLPSSDGTKTRNLSAFAGGFLEFAIASTAPLNVGMSWLPAGSTAELQSSVPASQYLVGTDASGWQQIRIPLCAFGADLAHVVGMATFAVTAQSAPTTFCWDAVRIRKASTTCSKSCTVGLLSPDPFVRLTYGEKASARYFGKSGRRL